MKKIIFTVAAVVAVMGSSFAQKATLDNPWSLEGAINYSGTGGIDWKAPTVRARYFVNENIAARVQLGLGDPLNPNTAMSEKYNYFENGDGTGRDGTLEINRMQWKAQIGGEYHLAGTDRLSPYFALGINFGGGNSKIVGTDVFPANPADLQNGNPDKSDFGYANGFSSERTGKFSMFGIGLGAGLDVYVIENLYLGLELGINFDSYKYGEGNLTYTTPAAGGGSTTVTGVSAEYSKSHLSTGPMNAAFRLGWRF